MKEILEGRKPSKDIFKITLLFVLASLIFVPEVFCKKKGETNLTAKKGGGAKMKISSPAFANGERIPKKYTCEGEDISPPLKWENPPEGTKSFVLIVDDPDAPIGTFNHWIVWNVPADVRELPENLPKKGKLENGIMQGRNDFGKIGWGGPCPPRGHGTHRYFFKLKALSVEKLDLPEGATKSDLLKAIEGKVIGEAEFYGTYSR